MGISRFRYHTAVLPLYKLMNSLCSCTMFRFLFILLVKDKIHFDLDFMKFLQAKFFIQTSFFILQNATAGKGEGQYTLPLFQEAGKVYHLI